jgi:UDP-N-acetylglucosamine acyltransferase
MAGCHVAHDCRVANHIILVNGCMLAGHVTVDDRAVISGNCLVHQFVRIGMLAMMQGGSAASKDLPPYTVARGVNGMCGLNTVGLRRAGLSAAQRLELKQLYRALFRTDASFRTALAEATQKFSSPTARVLLDFLAKGERGFCADTGRVAEEED